MARRKRTQEDTEHRDPITKTPGAHPVGVGAGAAGAGAAGAAIGGAVGGPLGAVVGAAVGAFAGGLGGKAAAESVNPTLENTWWRENYATRPYAKAGERAIQQYAWEDAVTRRVQAGLVGRAPCREGRLGAGRSAAGDGREAALTPERMDRRASRAALPPATLAPCAWCWPH